MIYHKIWLVVKPTVGVPLFLAAVAVSSFAVHVALATQIDWLKPYWNNTKMPTKAAVTTTESTVAAAAVPSEKPKAPEKAN